jgi:Tol biopolymer transport system component
VIEDLSTNPLTGGGQFAFSSRPTDSGTFVYLSGKHPAVSWQTAWLDSAGKFEPLHMAPGVYTNPRVSPDGNRLAIVNGSDIFVHDLERETSMQLATGQVTAPVWAPDGNHLVYVSSTDRYRILWVRADGTGEPVPIVESKDALLPHSFAPDGRLAYYQRSRASRRDVIWTVPLDLTNPDHPKPGTPELFLQTTASALNPRFSPDGSWIAYSSTESGRGEFYVRPFPAARGGKWQVSNGGGGSYAFWSKNGHELFYEANGGRLMVVDYTVSRDIFLPGKPRPWTEKQFLSGLAVPNADIHPDGKRFLVFAPLETGKEPVQVTMLLNFFDELRRRLPPGK